MVHYVCLHHLSFGRGDVFFLACCVWPAFSLHYFLHFSSLRRGFDGLLILFECTCVHGGGLLTGSSVVY